MERTDINNTVEARVERRKHESDHDMLQQLWYVIIGTNGEGMAARMARLEERVDKMAKNVWTRTDHEIFERLHDSRDAERRQIDKDTSQRLHEVADGLRRYGTQRTMMWTALAAVGSAIVLGILDIVK